MTDKERQQITTLHMISTHVLARELQNMIDGGYEVTHVVRMSPLTSPETDGVFAATWMIIYR